MAFVSVTRLRPRSLLQLPVLAFHTWKSYRQLGRADGFLGGYLASGAGLAFWTVTLWADQDAMRAYRDTAAHRAAMPVLIGACDEAALAHWLTDETTAPSPAMAAAKLKQGGRTSKLRHPSPRHAAGDPLPDARPPRVGPSLGGSGNRHDAPGANKRLRSLL